MLWSVHLRSDWSDQWTTSVRRQLKSKIRNTNQPNRTSPPIGHRDSPPAERTRFDQQLQTVSDTKADGCFRYSEQSKTDRIDQFERRPTKTLNLHIRSLFFHIWILVFGFCLCTPEISRGHLTISLRVQVTCSEHALAAKTLRVQTWFRSSGALGRAETWDLIFDVCARLRIVSLLPINCSQSLSSGRECGQVRLSVQVWFYLKHLGGSPSAFMCHQLPENSWLGGSQEQTKLIWRLLLWKPFPGVDDEDEATG